MARRRGTENASPCRNHSHDRVKPLTFNEAVPSELTATTMGALFCRRGAQGIEGGGWK